MIAITTRVQTVILRARSASTVVFVNIAPTGRTSVSPMTMFKCFIGRNGDLFIRTIAIHFLAFGFKRLFRRHKINVVLRPSSTRCKESYDRKSYLFHIVSVLLLLCCEDRDLSDIWFSASSKLRAFRFIFNNTNGLLRLLFAVSNFLPYICSLNYPLFLCTILASHNLQSSK